MNWKKYTAAALAVFLCCVGMPLQDLLAFRTSTVTLAAEDISADAFSYEVNAVGDGITITEYHGNGGAVVIPAEIDGMAVTSIGERAFYDCETLTSISIPEGVTRIGESAFACCSCLTSIAIPASVTEIGWGAFGKTMFDCTPWLNAQKKESPLVIVNGILIDARDCEGEVVVPSSVTSIGDGAFRNCSEVTSVMLPERVTHIGQYAFSTCGRLTDITVPKGVMRIGERAFEYCASLTHVTLSEGVTHIGDGAFWSCSALTSITLPEGLTSIGQGAFGECARLTHITIPESVVRLGQDAFYGTPWLEAKRSEQSIIIENGILIEGKSCTGDVVIPDDVTCIGGGAFYRCQEINSITIPEGVVYIEDYAFYGCEGITSITIPAGVVHIEDYAFAYCTAVKEISVADSVETIGAYAFCGCNSVKELKLPASLHQIGAQALCIGDLETISIASANPYFTVRDGVLYDKSMQELLKYPQAKPGAEFVIPSTVQRIAAQAFYNVGAHLETVSIPTSVTEIGDEAFCYCTGLRSVSIPDSVTSLGVRVWEDCSALQTAVVGSGIETLPMYTFMDCSALTCVQLGDNLKSLERYAFCGCKSLAGITLPDSLERIGTEVFWNCPALHDVTLGKGLKQIGAQAFYECRAIRDITLPEGVTTIGHQAFYGCASITEVMLPASVTSLGSEVFGACTKLERVTFRCDLSEIPEAAFRGCIKLKDVQLPLQLHTIETEAFFGCAGLTDITLPETVQYIHASAFANCSSLRALHLPSELYQIGACAFSNCGSLNDVIVPPTVYSIGEKAFEGCLSLKDVYMQGEYTELLADAFTSYDTNAKYSYEFFALNDGETEWYSGYSHLLLIQTDNPDPDSFSIVSDCLISDDDSLSTRYEDIQYKNEDDSNRFQAVEGGYLWKFRMEYAGDYRLMVLEHHADRKQITIAKAIQITVQDYQTARDAWMDEIISSQTTDTMTSFEKMEAISNYLLSTFKYLRNKNVAADTRGPFFVERRWDSCTSPSVLCEFAAKIGGFDKIDNLYYHYMLYGYAWSNGHYLCYCEANGEGRFYEACPLTPTGYVNVKTIDFSDPSQLYPLKTAVDLHSDALAHLTIHGIAGSAAERFATESAIPFAGMVLGDFDGDGDLTISDAVLLARFSVEDTTLDVSALHLENAECDGASGITAADVVALLRWLAEP